jgi:hypothetical protein
MAKPRELYSGAAPQAMSMMGMGIADAYARAGQLEGQGYAALGQGIGQGLSKVGAAVGDYLKEIKQIETQNKSYESLLGNERGRALFGFKNKDEVDALLASTKDKKPREQNQIFNTVLPKLMTQNLQIAEKEAAGRVDMRKSAFDALLGDKRYSGTAGVPEDTSVSTFDPNEMGFGPPRMQGEMRQPSIGESFLKRFQQSQTSWDR